MSLFKDGGRFVDTTIAYELSQIYVPVCNMMRFLAIIWYYQMEWRQYDVAIWKQVCGYDHSVRAVANLSFWCNMMLFPVIIMILPDGVMTITMSSSVPVGTQVHLKLEIESWKVLTHTHWLRIERIRVAVWSFSLWPKSPAFSPGLCFPEVERMSSFRLLFWG